MKKLLRDLKKKKHKAQHELFKMYGDFLYRVCYRYMANRDDAHEVLSKAFVNIFEKLADTDIETEVVLKSWMKKVAINQSLMELRKRKVFYAELELIEEIAEDTISADQALLEADLMQMLFELPDGYRTVFSLYVIEGFKHDEIAQKLDISVNTSKSQLRKARLQLQQMINKTEMRYEEVRRTRN
ncbi:RNA polymerase sigma factor [Saccharicrinis aurantiacus]|uniref:RNA polymerase sigma factor n=1 Tax=Saccharicrinis aurantiacus TaxID=1849719 RepID=UPI002492A711|nr:sigma-70 family RNA polymerase sigma factor [Saccharicrinis aurantiacus]